jgi:hypothetical protein
MVPQLLTLLEEVLLIASVAVIGRGLMTRAFLRALFSKWFFGVYFALSVAYLIASPLMVSDENLREVLFKTLGLMSGTDPFTFRAEIESHLTLWILAWLIHIASWLLIPALIAIVIADAKDEIMNEKAFVSTLGDILRKSGKDPKLAQELRRIIDQKMKDMGKEKHHGSTGPG